MMLRTHMQHWDPDGRLKKVKPSKAELPYLHRATSNSNMYVDEIVFLDLVF